MPIVSVHLSDAAHDEFKRIPKGSRSRVVTKFLLSRSREIIQPDLEMSGNELAEYVVELRKLIEEGKMARAALRNQIEHKETQLFLLRQREAEE